MSSSWMKHQGMHNDSAPRQLARRSSFAKEYGGGAIKPLTLHRWFRSMWSITGAPVIRFFKRVYWKLTGGQRDPDMTKEVQGHLWRGEHEVRKGRQVHVELDTLQSDIARTIEKRKRYAWVRKRKADDLQITDD